MYGTVCHENMAVQTPTIQNVQVCINVCNRQLQYVHAHACIYSGNQMSQNVLVFREYMSCSVLLMCVSLCIISKFFIY